MTTASELYRQYSLCQSDARNAALACKEASRDSISTKYLFPDAFRADHGVITMSGLVVRYATVYGKACSPIGAIERMACWYGENELKASLLRIARASGLAAALRDPGPWKRLVEVEPHLARTRKKWMKGSPLYIDLPANMPGLQRRGYGATLLRHLTYSADSENLPCCVETFEEEDAAIYRRFGFDVAQGLKSAPPGEATCFMVRKPGPCTCAGDGP